MKDKMSERKRKTLLQNAKVATPKEKVSDLNARVWAVITHEKIVERGLFHEEAVFLATALRGESGVCVVTDAAASRINQ